MVLSFLIKWIHRRVARSVRRHLRQFEEATHNPEQCQEDLLKRIIRSQADTGFGRDHRFASILTTADFRHNIPVAAYEYVEPYINRVCEGELGALLSDRTVHMFALT